MFLLKPMQQSPHLDCVIVEPELSGFGRGDFFLPKGRLLLFTEAFWPLVLLKGAAFSG